jgi:DnaJ-class molecular chaperone
MTADQKVCPACSGRGVIEIHTLSNESNDSSQIQTVRTRKCLRCEGLGTFNFGTKRHPCAVAPPADPAPSEPGTFPPGAEVMQ